MTYEEKLFLRHRGKSILLDSNLLLVFLTGAVDTRLFGRFKRVSGYTIDDYEFLIQLLGSFKILLTTPHILTEVSNLANSLTDSYRQEWYSNFAALILSDRQQPGIQENLLPAKLLASTSEFVNFGITDSAIAELASSTLLVTDDGRLSSTLRNKGVDVLSFKELRAMQERVP
jgi:rRNA-processing protein FCF1